MDALQINLEAIVQCIDNFVETAGANNIDDCKQLKYLNFVNDNITEHLQNCITKLAGLRQKTNKKIAGYLHTFKSQIEIVRPSNTQENQSVACSNQNTDAKQKIEYPPGFEPRRFCNIGDNITVEVPVFANKGDIPPMSYGWSIADGLLLYRFRNDWVSCTASVIGETTNHANIKTICCINGENCSYGVSCKYFHDPLFQRNSCHIQKFPKNPILIKKCPNFGNSTSFQSQISTLKFEDLRTLARYCVYMNLLIAQISNQ